MKIDKTLINKIFNKDQRERIKIKNKSDKIKLSEYNEFIPMYDIYSEKIYPISKENLYYRLIECHSRFITEEIKQWITNKFKKTKDANQSYNLEIIENYDIKTLLETSYKTLYKNSHKLGLSISICKRNSFNKYSRHLTPYYTKDELIKLGLNMKIINHESNSKLDLNDEQVHYKICKKISKNDISSQEILEHTKFIIASNISPLIANYSFMGSYYMNRYLRGVSKEPDHFLITIINKLASTMMNSPQLNNDYYLYRFIWDDSFIKKLQIGDTFIDEGFISTTRDPFYSPGLKSNFGLILVKIKIPKNKNIGLLIENLSLFPKEEEYLLPPKTELKLISKDNKFKYYHVNSQFENLIESKYEFELIGSKFKPLKNINNYDSFKVLDHASANIYTHEDSKIEIIRYFLRDYKVSNNQLNLEVDGRKYIIYYNWFDGTDSYKKLYYNKTGIHFTVYDDNEYPYINIEFGDEMIVNYLNQFYFYNKKRMIDKLDMELILRFAYIFKYNTFRLYLEYKNFSDISGTQHISESDSSYLYTNMYCNSLYMYLKENKKFYSNLEGYIDFFKFDFGYWKLNKLLDTPMSSDLQSRFKSLYDKQLTIKEFIIDIIENNFYYYAKLNDLFIQYEINNIFEKLYLDVDVGAYHQSKNNVIDKTEIPYEINKLNDNVDFKLVFNQPIRRIN
jgi:hypothetical protein|uniref:ADP ribosyltransferase domain-containing protein n=1 Tax=viral metagenome TaxID=1070528 RepID=A0A6C0IUK6_9ZZZZ